MHNLCSVFVLFISFCLSSSHSHHLSLFLCCCFFTIPLPVYQHLFLNSFLIIPSHRVSLPSPWHSPVSISCHLSPITNPPLQLLFVSVVSRSLSLSGFWNPSTFPSVPLLLLILSCSLSPFCLKVSLISFYPLCPDFVSTCSSHIFYNIVVKYHFHHAFSVIAGWLLLNFCLIFSYNEDKVHL